jgi:hypothetical protein
MIQPAFIRSAAAPSRRGAAAKSVVRSIDGGDVRAARHYQERLFEVLLAQVSNDEDKQVMFSGVPVAVNSRTR